MRHLKTGLDFGDQPASCCAMIFCLLTMFVLAKS
jgi:hypothetical protein